jgi:4-amino-4-deoxy-L-arabinose transferase-like glycosyltransferase
MLIIAGAVLVRLAAAVYMGDQVADAPGTFDQLSYDMLARRVLGGHGFTVETNWWPATRAGEPTAHWSYVYTLYLAAVYAVFGYHPLAARLIQATLAGVLMPWLTYRLGRRHFGPPAGLAAAGLSAAYAYFVYYAGALMTETFYMLAILWTLDAAGRLGEGREPARRTWLWLGLALAVAVLLRQVFLLFIPILFAWLVWRSWRGQARPLRDVVLSLAGASVIVIMSIIPWTLRNYRAFEAFVLLNTNAGFAFFWGNHPIHGTNFIAILPASGPSYQDLIPPELLPLNEAELDRALLGRGVDFVRADPLRYALLSLSRAKDFFKFWPAADSGTISNLSRVLSFGILWPFMLYGLVQGVRRYASLSLVLYLFIAAYTGIHLLTWALIRYRLPVDAVLLPFAGLALADVWGWLRARA